MEYQNALRWIAFVTGLEVKELWEKFTSADVDPDLVLDLGWALSQRPRVRLLADPPRERDYQPKPYTFICQCGCGETVTRSYITGRKPIYKDAAHRERVYRRNRKARQDAR